MEILIIAGLLLLNGLFAMFEIALVSSNASRLETLSLKGNKSARLVIQLRKHPEEVLSTIQVGIASAPTRQQGTTGQVPTGLAGLANSTC
jgi:putative hemolysin